MITESKKMSPQGQDRQPEFDFNFLSEDIKETEKHMEKLDTLDELFDDK